MRLVLSLVLHQGLSFVSTAIRILIFFQRFVILFAAPLFAILCTSTYLHPKVLIFSHSAYYFCTFILTRVCSIVAVTLVIFSKEAFVTDCERAFNIAAFADPTLVYCPFSLAPCFGKSCLLVSIGWGVGWGRTLLAMPNICENVSAVGKTKVTLPIYRAATDESLL